MHRSWENRRVAALVAAVGLAFAASASAEIAVSSNDHHSVLVDGAMSAAKGANDTVSIIDLGRYPPRIVATLEAPGSVVGPPGAVAVSKDESFALVTSSTKLDPQDPSKIVSDDRLSVIDLKSAPPKVVQQLATGAGAAGVSLSPDGTLVLVANRNEGTVSILAIKDKHLEAVGKLDLGNAKAGPSHVAFAPDGKTALVTRDGDSMVSVLHVEGAKVTLDKRPLTTAVRPYNLDFSRDGRLAAVSNMGRSDGDVDSVSLIDMTAQPIRTVLTMSVGPSPEGLKFSPDGKILAVGLQNGSNKPKSSPFYHDGGRLILFAVEGHRLRQVAEAPIGHWSQGIAFSRDGRTILVQAMVEQAIAVFRWEGGKLTRGKPLAIGGGPAAIRTSWP